jgi:AcrR family transcriptional regulator
MEDIASRAGVAVGTLYNYFRDRAALVAALTEARRGALVARLDEATGPGGGLPLAEALGGLLAAFFAHWAEHAPLLARLHEAGQLGRTGRGRATDVVREVGARIERLLRAAPPGTVRAGVEPGPAAAALVGMARGVALAAQREGRRPGPREAAVVLDLFLRGVEDGP